MSAHVSPTIELVYFTLGKVIRGARVVRNMKQRDLAQRIGVSHSHISNIERASVRVQVHQLQALIGVLQLPNTLITTKLTSRCDTVRWSEYGRLRCCCETRHTGEHIYVADL